MTYIKINGTLYPATISGKKQEYGITTEEVEEWWLDFCKKEGSE